MEVALALLAVLTVHQDGPWYRFAFAAHRENVGVRAVTQCKGDDPFFATNYVDVEPDWTVAQMRRVPTPVGARCTVVGYVMRNTAGREGSPDLDYVGESVVIVQVERNIVAIRKWT